MARFNSLVLRPFNAIICVVLSNASAYTSTRESASRFQGVVTARRPESRTMCSAKKDNVEPTTNNESNAAGFKQQTWNPLRLGVLRLGLTEPAMTSPLNYGKHDGQFHCAFCDQLLFDSTAKYDSGTGWPSFWRSAGPNMIKYKREMNGSLECQCQQCSSHLGHVFLDGPRPLTVEVDVLAGKPATDPERTDGRYLPRFCMNGAALTYKPRAEQSS